MEQVIVTLNDHFCEFVNELVFDFDFESVFVYQFVNESVYGFVFVYKLEYGLVISMTSSSTKQQAKTQ